MAISAEPREFDLLVAGELNPDVIVTGGDVAPMFGQVEKIVDGVALAIGSSSAITACGAARLGLRVAFVGVVGDDPFGRWMLEALRAKGIDVTGSRTDPSTPTGATVILARRGDRAILTALGTTTALTAGDLPDGLLARARHLHVGSVFLQDALRAELATVFDRARALGLSTSFDPGWDPRERWDGGIDAVLGAAHIALPNREEARRIAGVPEDLQAAQALIDRAISAGRRPPHRAAAMGSGPIIAVKLGSDGGLLVAGDTVARVDPPRAEPVDTTGAGDSFDAGFLAGWLSGRSPLDALRLAVACGSLSLRSIGGTEGQPTLDEARALAAQLAVTAVEVAGPPGANAG